MHATPTAFRAHPFNTSAIGGGDEPLPRHPAFRTRNLAVNFQEVVHSVRTGNADVATPQR